MYLLRSSTILWQTLNKSFNYLFKEKNERRFIFERLKLLDQEYCLVVEKHYWQSYLDIGLQKHIWPVSRRISLSISFNFFFFLLLLLLYVHKE